MGIFLYPEDYEEEAAGTPIVLTTEQVNQLKTWIKNKINTIDKPILVKVAIEYIQNALLIPNNIHVQDHIIRELVLEVRKEFGYPGQYRNDITSFSDAGEGFVTVTSIDHGLLESARIEIILTTNYNGVYNISNITTDTFDIETTWVSDDATGVVIR